MTKAPDQKAVRMACLRLVSRHTRDPQKLLAGAMLLVAFVEGADLGVLERLSAKLS